MERLKCTKDFVNELNLISFSATCFEFHEIEMFCGLARKGWTLFFLNIWNYNFFLTTIKNNYVSVHPHVNFKFFSSKNNYQKNILKIECPPLEKVLISEKKQVTMICWTFMHNSRVVKFSSSLVSSSTTSTSFMLG